MKSNLGLMEKSKVLMKANLVTSLMVPMMTFLWAFVSFFYLASSMVLLIILMTPLMVSMMTFSWVHKWKLYLAENVMAPLMVPIMACLWVHKWKLYLASSAVIMEENLMAPLIILGCGHP